MLSFNFVKIESRTPAVTYLAVYNSNDGTIIICVLAFWGGKTSRLRNDNKTAVNVAIWARWHFGCLDCAVAVAQSGCHIGIEFNVIQPYRYRIDIAYNHTYEVCRFSCVPISNDGTMIAFDCWASVVLFDDASIRLEFNYPNRWKSSFWKQFTMIENRLNNEFVDKRGTDVSAPSTKLSIVYDKLSVVNLLAVWHTCAGLRQSMNNGTFSRHSVSSTNITKLFIGFWLFRQIQV